MLSFRVLLMSGDVTASSLLWNRDKTWLLQLRLCSARNMQLALTLLLLPACCGSLFGNTRPVKLTNQTNCWVWRKTKDTWRPSCWQLLSFILLLPRFLHSNLCENVYVCTRQHVTLSDNDALDSRQQSCLREIRKCDILLINWQGNHLINCDFENRRGEMLQWRLEDNQEITMWTWRKWQDRVHFSALE